MPGGVAVGHGAPVPQHGSLCRHHGGHGVHALAAAVRQAKKDGLADNFTYGSVSPDYLAAVMDAL